MLGYVSLIAACLYAFRVLSVWLTYRYFWVNAWDEVLVFAALVAVHLLTRPRDDPRFRKVTKWAVVATLVAMAALLTLAFTIRIA